MIVKREKKMYGSFAFHANNWSNDDNSNNENAIVRSSYFLFSTQMSNFHEILSSLFLFFLHSYLILKMIIVMISIEMIIIVRLKSTI